MAAVINIADRTNESNRANKVGTNDEKLVNQFVIKIE